MRRSTFSVWTRFLFCVALFLCATNVEAIEFRPEVSSPELEGRYGYERPGYLDEYERHDETLQRLQQQTELYRIGDEPGVSVVSRGGIDTRAFERVIQEETDRKQRPALKPPSPREQEAIVARIFGDSPSKLFGGTVSLPKASLDTGQAVSLGYEHTSIDYSAFGRHGIVGRSLRTGEMILTRAADPSRQDLDDLIFDQRTHPQTILATTPEMYLQARNTVRWRAETGRLTTASPPLVVYNKTKQPPAAINAALNHEIRSIQILYSIPATARQAATVHGTDGPLGTDVDWTVRRQFMRSNVPSAHDIGEELQNNETYSSGLKRLLQSAAAQHTDLVLLIGEIRAGQMYFPDSSVPVAELSRNDVTVAVVGCNSANSVEPQNGYPVISIGRRITYEQAMQVSWFISETVRSRHPALRELMLMMQQTPLPSEIDTVPGATRFAIVVTVRMIVQAEGSLIMERAFPI